MRCNCVPLFGRVCDRHLYKVVILDLDQCLLVVEVLEVAVQQVERGSVCSITMYRIEAVQVEQYTMAREIVHLWLQIAAARPARRVFVV